MSKKEIKKNIAADPAPSFDVSIYPTITKTDKDGTDRKYYIVPDDIFDQHLKELPPGTYNKSMSYRAFNGGKLYQIGSDPEKDKEITTAGAAATNATLAKRRTFREEANILLGRLDKSNNKTGLENITMAMYERAMAGDVKAYTALRDTAGEKPADSLDLNANIMTEADQALIEKLKSRTGIQ